MTCRVGVLLLVALVACNDDESSPGNTVLPGAQCPPGERLVGEQCVAAGVQDDGCPAGELGIEGGGCQPAGIPACAEGFLPTMDGSCEPVLPSGTCTRGLMALPGDELCREIVSCGRAPWGDIAIEPATEFVDASYPGLDSDGTELKPWRTIGEAITSATPGAIVAIAEGSYAEDLVISGKKVRLWGRCPALVEIVGTGATQSTFFVMGGATDTVVRGLSITGSGLGVLASGSTGVRFEAVRVHDLPDRAFGIESGLGATEVTIADSLIEKATDMGVFVAGADVTIERSVVRAIQPSVDGFGRGVSARTHPQNFDRGSLAVRGSVIEGNTDSGIFVSGADCSVEASVVRDTQPRPDLDWGRGIIGQTDADTGERAVLTVTSSWLAANHQAGIVVYASDAQIEGTVVRETLPSQLDGAWGLGAVFQQHDTTGDRSSATIRASVFEHNHEAGIEVGRSDAVIEGVIVRDMRPRLVDMEEGRGIVVRFDAAGEGSTATIRGSLVERTHDHGIVVGGSQATIEGVLVRDTLPNASDGRLGRGIGIQDSPMGVPSTADIHASVIERAHDVGLAIWGSDANIEATVVRETKILEGAPSAGFGIGVQMDDDTGNPSTATLRFSVVDKCLRLGIMASGADMTIADTLVRDTAPGADGFLGDGIVVHSIVGPAQLRAERVRIERSERAAFGNFGAEATLVGSELLCQDFDIVAEPFMDIEPKMHDGGGNRCGCPTAADSCKSESSGIEPPTALGH